MSSLLELLARWESWLADETARRALATPSEAACGGGARGHLERPVDPLDALRGSAELIRLLSGWQWQAVYAARRDGATWAQVADALGVTVHEARADFVAALERMDSIRSGGSAGYRSVVDL